MLEEREEKKKTIIVKIKIKGKYSQCFSLKPWKFTMNIFFGTYWPQKSGSTIIPPARFGYETMDTQWGETVLARNMSMQMSTKSLIYVRMLSEYLQRKR